MICKYFDIVKFITTRKFTIATTLTFRVDYLENICYFHWTLHEMWPFAHLNGTQLF